MVSLVESIETASSCKELFTVILVILLIINSHHVFYVISSIIMFWALQDSDVPLLIVCFAGWSLESLKVFKVATTSDSVFKTLGCCVSIALSVDILWFNTGDETCIPWNTLVPDFMLRSIDPSHRILTCLSKCFQSLCSFIWAIDWLRTRLGHQDLVCCLPSDVSLTWLWMLANQVAESSLFVTLSSGEANMLLLVRNEARVSRDFLRTIHIWTLSRIKTKYMRYIY